MPPRSGMQADAASRAAMHVTSQASGDQTVKERRLASAVDWGQQARAVMRLQQGRGGSGGLSSLPLGSLGLLSTWALRVDAVLKAVLSRALDSTTLRRPFQRRASAAPPPLFSSSDLAFISCC
ncbi:MAG: hypothetical protein FRX49_00680 [Trebouxia sp. A1-2]|nr:MAG: hypothetical protein FRX49_00680 [Trebouxia sp. A1-2]